jgi:hypothetical protein
LALYSILSNVTSGAFPAVVTGVSTTNFSSAKVADAVTTLNTNNAPNDPRATLVLPAYFGALLKDSTVISAQAFGGSEAIRNGTIPSLIGTVPNQYGKMNIGGVANEGRVGFTCSNDALLFASKAPALPVEFPGEVQNFTDPDSQFTVQIRKFYDVNAGTSKLSAGILYGTAPGNSGSLVRYVTGVL